MLNCYLNKTLQNLFLLVSHQSFCTRNKNKKKTPKPSVVQERSPVWFSNDTIRHVHHAKYQSEPTSSDTFQYSSLSLKLMQYKY